MAKRTIKGPLPPDTRTFVQRVRDRVVEWKKGKGKEPDRPIHVRQPDKKLNAAFDAMIAKAKTRGNFNAELESSREGFSIYCRIQPRMHLYPNGSMAMYYAFTIANLHMPDNLRNKGLFPAFLDHVEQVLLQASEPKTVREREYKGQTGVVDHQRPILAVYVESITNPDLTHYLRERRSGKYRKPADAFAHADLVRFREDADTYMIAK